MVVVKGREGIDARRLTRITLTSELSHGCATVRLLADQLSVRDGDTFFRSILVCTSEINVPVV